MDVDSSSSSRDPTPSSSSSQPTLPNTADSAASSQGQGHQAGGDDVNVERFLKKMEMEKVSAAAAERGKSDADIGIRKLECFNRDLNSLHST